KSYNSFSDKLDVTDKPIIGISSKENLFKDGVLASSGKSLIAELIFRCASVSKKLTSAPSFNVTITIEAPSKEVDSIFFTISKDATASSIFLVTVFSTSVGEAPGYTVWMVITFTSKFGINSYPN